MNNIIIFLSTLSMFYLISNRDFNVLKEKICSTKLRRKKRNDIQGFFLNMFYRHCRLPTSIKHSEVLIERFSTHRPEGELIVY